MPEQDALSQPPSLAALERWRRAEQAYSDAIWAILNADGAPLAKKAHKQLKDLRYAADDRQRKYYRSLRKG